MPGRDHDGRYGVDLSIRLRGRSGLHIPGGHHVHGRMAGQLHGDDDRTPSPTITESGGLDGLTLSDGVLSGTPTAVGVFPVTFTASNGFGQDATQAAVITVLGLHVTTASLPEATPGQAYNTQLTALGGTAPYKWKASAKLPKGLKLSSTGILSGSVSARVAAGTATVSVEVTDSTPRHKGTATASFSLVIS